MEEKFLTKSAVETKNLGYILAKNILRQQKSEKAIVLALIGELGGGKTTFLQGFAKGLGIKEKILSPTFVILKRFKITKIPCLPAGRKNLRLAGRQEKSKIKTTVQNFYHIDCYRIAKPEELLDLGLKEIIANPRNIVAIEWAGRIKKILPKNTLIIRFGFIDKTKRKICIEGLTNP